MLEAGFVSLKSIFCFKKFSTRRTVVAIVDRDMVSLNVILHVGEK